MSKYRTYPARFKAETVIESLRGQKSDAQICRERGIAPDLLSRWRQHFLERAEHLFASDQTRSAEQAKIAELEQLIGQLTVELTAAKKPRRSWPGARRQTGNREAVERRVSHPSAV